MKNLNLALILVLVVVALSNFVSASPTPRSLTGSLVARSSLVERQTTCVCPDGTACASDNTCPNFTCTLADPVCGPGCCQPGQTCSQNANGPICSV